MGVTKQGKPKGGHCHRMAMVTVTKNSLDSVPGDPTKLYRMGGNWT